MVAAFLLKLFLFIAKKQSLLTVEKVSSLEFEGGYTNKNFLQKE